MRNPDMIKEIDEAITAHSAMRRTLIFGVDLANQTRTPEQLADDHRCAFGYWLHGHAIDATTKAGRPYRVIDRLHQEFHRTAGRVAMLARDGQRDEALALINGEYSQRSDTLMRALSKWRAENAA